MQTITNKNFIKQTLVYLRLIAYTIIPPISFLSYYVFSGFNSYAELNYKNAHYIFPKSLFIPIILGLIVALIISLISTIVYKKNINKAVLFSLLLSISAGTYHLHVGNMKAVIQGLLPIIPNNVIVLNLIYLFLLCVIFYYLTEFIFNAISIKYVDITKQIGLGVIGFSIFILFSNLIPTLIFIKNNSAQYNYIPKDINGSGYVVNQNSPNVYYIVLDRYTNNVVLKDVLGYDNSNFTDFLKSEQFSVDTNAHSNYPYTALSIASTLNASYLDQVEDEFAASNKEISTAALFRAVRYNSVAREFKDMGYKYNVIGSWYGIANKAPIADKFYYEYSKINIGNKSIGLQEYDEKMINNSPLSDMLIGTGSLTKQDPVELTHYQLNTLNSIAKDKETKHFTFAHITVPHDPFVFNADGSINAENTYYDDVGKKVENKYLDQVKYISNEMKYFIKNIDANDPNAIVIIQSDEGFYPDLILGDDESIDGNGKVKVDMKDWSDKYIQSKFGVLAAYRLPNISETALTPGTDSVNIFRFILNNYYSYKLDYLPNCQLGRYDSQDKEYLMYTDMTNRFTDKPDPLCSSIHDQ